MSSHFLLLLLTIIRKELLLRWEFLNNQRYNPIIFFMLVKRNFPCMNVYEL